MSAGGESPRPAGKKTDFSDALGDRRIEEIQPPRFAGANNGDQRRSASDREACTWQRQKWSTPMMR